MKKKNLVMIVIVTVIAIELFGVASALINLGNEPITNLSLNGFLDIYRLVEPKSSLKLLLSTNSTVIQPGQAIGISISLYNNSSLPLDLPVQDNWPIKDLSVGGCSFLPLGIGIIEGYYTENNITDAKPLSLFFQPSCAPFGPIVKAFTFQPLSHNATVECQSSNSAVDQCPSIIKITANLAYSRFLKDQGFFNFNVGTYTLVGGDEWGHLAIRHFTVTNSTSN